MRQQNQYVDGLIKAGDTVTELVDVEINSLGANNLFGHTGKYQIYTLVAQGGNFQVGDNITGNFTNATGTVVDVQNVTIGGSNFNRLTYTVGTGAFTGTRHCINRWWSTVLK